MGEGPKKDEPKKKDFKLVEKKTLADGNCFYSAIYRSLVYKNLLDKFCKCVNINCENEKEFIKNLRLLLANDNNLKIEYERFFNYAIMLIRTKNVKTLKEIIKNLGDTRDVIEKFLKDKKFVSENFENFFEDIQNVVKKDRKYVGEIEVTVMKDILNYDCDINVEIFTNKKSAENAIKSFSENTYKNTLVFIINTSSEHFTYM